jgi:hypothetical protein
MALAMLVSAGAIMPASGPQSGVNQTIDRIVAAVGNEAITQSDVDREYAFEGLISDGHLPAAPPDPRAFQATLERLIDKTVLEDELKNEPPSAGDMGKAAAERLNEIRRRASSPGAFDRALRSLGVDERQLLARLTLQEGILRMLNRRLRSRGTPDASEIRAYYRDTFVPECRKRGTGSPPALTEVEAQIREILVQQKINQQLNGWLEELRAAHNVRQFGNLQGSSSESGAKDQGQEAPAPM